ncbi:hypothetical protein Ancab_033606, partial [Ancistrocladus abbreviatus]
VSELTSFPMGSTLGILRSITTIVFYALTEKDYQSPLWIRVDEVVFPILAIEEAPAFEDRTGAYWQDNDGSFDMSFLHAAFISVMPESVGTANVNDKPSQAATFLATIADSPIPFLGTNIDAAATPIDPRNYNDEMVLEQFEFERQHLDTKHLANGREKHSTSSTEMDKYT